MESVRMLNKTLTFQENRQYHGRNKCIGIYTNWHQGEVFRKKTPRETKENQKDILERTREEKSVPENEGVLGKEKILRNLRQLSKWVQRT